MKGIPHTAIVERDPRVRAKNEPEGGGGGVCETHLDKFSNKDQEENPWLTDPWTKEEVTAYVDYCIRRGDTVHTRAGLIKSILAKKDPLDHDLIESVMIEIENERVSKERMKAAREARLEKERLHDLEVERHRAEILAAKQAESEAQEQERQKLLQEAAPRLERERQEREAAGQVYLEKGLQIMADIRRKREKKNQRPLD